MCLSIQKRNVLARVIRFIVVTSSRVLGYLAGQSVNSLPRAETASPFDCWSENLLFVHMHFPLVWNKTRFGAGLRVAFELIAENDEVVVVGGIQRQKEHIAEIVKNVCCDVVKCLAATGKKWHRVMWKAETEFGNQLVVVTIGRAAVGDWDPETFIKKKRETLNWMS